MATICVATCTGIRHLMEESQYIPLNDCQDRVLYRLDSRNLSLGVYCAEEKSFIGLRSKFGDRFLFTEYHVDTGEPIGTACPLEALGVLPPSITLAETLGVRCSRCHRPLRHEPSESTGHDRDVHEDGTPKCDGAWAVSIPNVALYDYLASKLKMPPGRPRDEQAL